jgi:hypothetical protein
MFSCVACEAGYEADTFEIAQNMLENTVAQWQSLVCLDALQAEVRCVCLQLPGSHSCIVVFPRHRQAQQGAIRRTPLVRSTMLQLGYGLLLSYATRLLHACFPWMGLIRKAWVACSCYLTLC